MNIVYIGHGFGGLWKVRSADDDTRFAYVPRASGVIAPSRELFERMNPLEKVGPIHPIPIPNTLFQKTLRLPVVREAVEIGYHVKDALDPRWLKIIPQVARFMVAEYGNFYKKTYEDVIGEEEEEENAPEGGMKQMDRKKEAVDSRLKMQDNRPKTGEDTQATDGGAKVVPVAVPAVRTTPEKMLSAPTFEETIVEDISRQTGIFIDKTRLLDVRTRNLIGKISDKVLFPEDTRVAMQEKGITAEEILRLYALLARYFDGVALKEKVALPAFKVEELKNLLDLELIVEPNIPKDLINDTMNLLFGEELAKLSI